MNFGTKIDGDKVVCLNCNVVVGKNQTKFSFCPRCGAPLNLNAGLQLEKYVNKEKLKLLYDVLDNSKDLSFNDFLKPYITELEKECEDWFLFKTAGARKTSFS